MSNRRDELQRIVNAIVIQSESDPEFPEYPPFAPRFPATPTVTVDVGERRIKLKDESWNPTGTHKDRMAWEVVVFYKERAQALLEAGSDEPLPRLSMISAGSAALAIQHQLRLVGLPNLKVLIHHTTRRPILRRLESLGCEVYPVDLDAELLTDEQVLELTENPGGINLSGRQVKLRRELYYDWLSFEILNQHCDYVFVPVGTGDLFRCILAVLRKELCGTSRDHRLIIEDRAQIEGRVILGATTENAFTSMDKLYRAFRPTIADARRELAQCIQDGVCSPRSQIHNVPESYVHRALAEAARAKIKTEASGISGLALYLSMVEEIPPEASVLVVNTGRFYTPRLAR